MDLYVNPRWQARSISSVRDDASRRARAALGKPILGRVQRAIASTLVPAIAAVVAFAAVAQGAFQAPEALEMCGAILLLAGLVAIGWPQEFPISGSALVMTALLIAPLVLASSLHGWTANSVVEVATATASAGAVMLGGIAGRIGLGASLLRAVMTVAALVALTGAVGVAAHVSPWGEPATGLWRASTSIGYPNAAATLLVMLTPVTALFVASGRRLIDRFVLTTLLLGVLLTSSRIGLVSVAVAAVLFAFTGHGRVLLASRRPAVAAIVAFAGFIPSITGPVALIPAVLTCVLAAVLVLMQPSHYSVIDFWRPFRYVIHGLVIIILAWLTIKIGITRALAGGEGRSATWQAAFEEIRHASLTGVGPGHVHLAYEWRGGNLITPFAHNEILQAIVETGAVGALCLLGALMIIIRSIMERSRAGIGPMTASCLIGASAFGLASFVDFPWHVPVLVVVVFLLAGLAFSRQAEEVRGWP